MKIALIAHDAKKQLMQNLCIAYRLLLIKHEICATQTTGRLVEEAAQLSVKKFLAGHLGGVQQICAEIEANEIDLVIFLHDSVTRKNNDPNPSNIMKLCDMHNIPIATNLATAEILIRALDRGDLDWREMYR